MLSTGVCTALLVSWRFNVTVIEALIALVSVAVT